MVWCVLKTPNRQVLQVITFNLLRHYENKKIKQSTVTMPDSLGSNLIQKKHADALEEVSKPREKSKS